MTEQPIPASPVEADLEFMKALQDKGPQNRRAANGAMFGTNSASTRARFSGAVS